MLAVIAIPAANARVEKTIFSGSSGPFNLRDSNTSDTDRLAVTHTLASDVLPSVYLNSECKDTHMSF
jgi:hypothetical protein